MRDAEGRFPRWILSRGVTRLILPSMEKLMLHTLLEFADACTGQCFPSGPVLWAAAGVNQKTGRRALRTLESRGLLVIRHPTLSSVLYVVNMEMLCQAGLAPMGQRLVVAPDPKTDQGDPNADHTASKSGHPKTDRGASKNGSGGIQKRIGGASKNGSGGIQKRMPERSNNQFTQPSNELSNEPNPPTPQGGVSGGEQQSIPGISMPRKPKLRIPTSLQSLSGRADEQMWLTLWQKVTKSTKSVFLEIVEVWDAYREVFPKKRVLDVRGANKIGDAVLLGYPVEDLKKVPLGASKSPWHMGANERGRSFTGVDTLFRDAKAIDAHIECADGGPEIDRTRDNLGRLQHDIEEVEL